MCRPYSVLHQVGFTVPRLLPAARCALAAPFRPYPTEAGRYAFCGTVPDPCRSGSRRALPGTFIPWSPDFPRPRNKCGAAVARSPGGKAYSDGSYVRKGRWKASLFTKGWCERKDRLNGDPGAVRGISIHESKEPRNDCHGLGAVGQQFCQACPSSRSRLTNHGSVTSNALPPLIRSNSIARSSSPRSSSCPMTPDSPRSAASTA